MPEAEEKIVQELVNKFKFLENRIKVQRPRRVWADVDMNNFYGVFVFTAKEMYFPHLLTITGLDEGDKFGIIYHLAHDSGVVLNLKTSVPRGNPVLKTVTEIFAGADIYERELVDLFGVKVEGLPAGNRYPLPDNWPQGQYPLRKDWKADVTTGEADKEAPNA